jgi:uncharacterized membrane protein YccF (DUF307 family)
VLRRQIDVLWLILGQVVGITIVEAIGVPVAIASTQLVRASLYGVAPADALSVAGEPWTTFATKAFLGWTRMF